MADDAKILFEVDAGQILAKLHLAGLQAVTLQKDEFVVNTAIKNDDPKAKPDKPGKVMFDLSNKQGQYQVGFVTTIEYNYGQNSQGDVEDLNKVYTVIKDASNNDDKGIDKAKVDDKNKALEKIKPELGKYLTANQNFLKNELNLDIGKNVDDFLKQNEFNIQIGEGDPQKVDLPTLVSTIYDKVNSKNQEQNKENDKNGRQVALEKASENALKQLEAYMSNFAGPDKSSGIKDNYSIVPISENIKDSNDANLVKVFEIQERPEKELEILKKKAELSKDHQTSEKICFVVKYDIELNR